MTVQKRIRCLGPLLLLVLSPVWADVRLRVGTGTADYELSLDQTRIDTISFNPVLVSTTFILSPETQIDLSFTSASATDGDEGQIGGADRQEVAFTVIDRFGQDNNGIFMYGLNQGSTTGLYAPDVYDYPIEFTAQGAFLGLGYAWRLWGGALSVITAASFMQGEFTYNTDVEDADNTVGLSYGLNYAYAFNKSMGLTLGYKNQSYEFTLTDDRTVTENLSQLSLGVAFTF